MSGAHCRTCWRYRGFAATSKTVAATRPMASNAARSTNRAYGENRWACTDGSAVNSGKADRIETCKLNTTTTPYAHRWFRCAPTEVLPYSSQQACAASIDISPPTNLYVLLKWRTWPGHNTEREWG